MFGSHFVISALMLSFYGGNTYVVLVPFKLLAIGNYLSREFKMMHYSKNLGTYNMLLRMAKVIKYDCHDEKTLVGVVNLRINNCIGRASIRRIRRLPIST